MVISTVPNRNAAKKLTRYLLDAHLAACVSVFPVTSVYWWKGKKETTREMLLLIKTQKRLFARIETLMKTLHPYEVPELIGIPVDTSGKAYRNWLRKELKYS